MSSRVKQVYGQQILDEILLIYVSNDSKYIPQAIVELYHGSTTVVLPGLHIMLFATKPFNVNSQQHRSQMHSSQLTQLIAWCYFDMSL